MGAPAAGSAPIGQPQRLGLIAGLLALVAALCIGGFIAYKIMFAAEPKETPTTTVVPATDATPPPAQPAEAPKDGSAAPASTATTTPDSSTSSQATGSTSPPGTDAKSAGAAPTDAAKANASKAAKAAAPAKSDTPATTAAPATAAPPPPRQAAAPAAPAPPPVDRWELMRQAYEACAREGLLDRLACNARVGRQYCEGYWGKVPQCPVGTYGDRAN